MRKPHQYPYWIVESRTGRLAEFVPLQYRHSPIEKMFKSGKIGGTRNSEEQFGDCEEAQRHAFSEERDGKQVEVLVVFSPQSSRRVCRGWKRRDWKGEA
jgi:hypothetical protein